MICGGASRSSDPGAKGDDPEAANGGRSEIERGIGRFEDRRDEGEVAELGGPAPDVVKTWMGEVGDKSPTSDERSDCKSRSDGR